MFAKKLYSLMTISTVFFFLEAFAQPAENPQTFCNPLNLNYRFMSDAVDAREAADPVMILFKGDYFLFASRSGGYWTSTDLRNWTLIIPTGLDVETYAPGVVIMRDTVFYTPSNSSQIYASGDPKSGVWKSRGSIGGYGDPAPFRDDDGKLYMYYGLSNNAPTRVVELDTMTFAQIGTPVDMFPGMASQHGWERRGDDNLLDEQPWIEGTWVVKENGKYYVHYAGPGTEFKTYSDGIYTADAPKGPFTYAPYSPFSFKPTGFMTGAGHGATFKDKEGRYWRVVTMVISVKNIFERRLGIYPVAFDGDGHIRANTIFGDYPQYYPGVKTNPISENFAGMMLLSHKKYFTASSSQSGREPEMAVDEESRTYWSAQTGDTGEWLMVDLGEECDVEAIQVNFAEHETNPSLVRGRTLPVYEQYTIEISDDGMNWSSLIDKSQNTKDVPHDYIELASTVKTRYVKMTNVFTPGNGKFALRGLRVFGNSTKAVFTPATNVVVNRDADGRNAVITWDPVTDADGYIVKYGIAADKLYNNYIVYDGDSISIHSLNKGVAYFFGVEAFDNGTDYYRATGEYRSYQSGNWNDVATWQKFDGTTWVHPAASVPSVSDAPLTILNGHAITLTASDSVDQLKIDSGATLIIPGGMTLKVKDGIGIDMNVVGALRNFGALAKDSSAVISFGGMYHHEQDGGAFPVAVWRSGSICYVDSIKGSAPSNGNQDFYNIVWNCPGQTSNLNLGWNGKTIGGNITIINTGASRWEMCAPAAGNSALVTINGDIIQSGGEFTSNGTSNGNTTIIINQAGNINVTGGNFSISRGGQGGTGTTTWNLTGGNVSLANATTQNSNSAGAKFVFTKDSSAQTLSFANVTFAGGFPVEVDSGTTLDIGSSILKGSGIFNLKAGATLQTSHPLGIDSVILTTGTKTFHTQAGYAYNGSSAQVTGTTISDAIYNLTINNSAGVTLSKTLTINGMMELQAGSLVLGGNVLQYGANGTLKYSGAGSRTTSDDEFPVTAGPANLISAKLTGLTLHASRTIVGELNLQSSKFTLGANTLTASSVSGATTGKYVVTNGAGVLKLPAIGSTQKNFPIGTTSSYAPVWITNTGTVDTISVGVASETTVSPWGGRIRAKWNIVENTPGGGNYTLQFGWISALEDTKFKQNKADNARIFLFPDSVEVGTGDYTTQLATQPFTVSRAGISTLGVFGVGKFANVTNVEEKENGIPNNFMLAQNYPNPFNPVTVIKYQLPVQSHVSLKIYDLLGRVVETLVDEVVEGGYQSVNFNAAKLSSGIYLYRLETYSGFTQTKKMIVLK